MNAYFNLCAKIVGPDKAAQIMAEISASAAAVPSETDLPSHDPNDQFCLCRGALFQIEDATTVKSSFSLRMPGSPVKNESQCIKSGHYLVTWLTPDEVVVLALARLQDDMAKLDKVKADFFSKQCTVDQSLARVGHSDRFYCTSDFVWGFYVDLPLLADWPVHAAQLTEAASHTRMAVKDFINHDLRGKPRSIGVRRGRPVKSTGAAA